MLDLLHSLFQLVKIADVHFFTPGSGPYVGAPGIALYDRSTKELLVSLCKTEDGWQVSPFGIGAGLYQDGRDFLGRKKAELGSPHTSMANPMSEIQDEQRRQYQKWGEQNHSDLMWLAILSEEIGEASKAILEMNDDHVHDEVVQIATVALAWLECMERRSNNSVQPTEYGG